MSEDQTPVEPPVADRRPHSYSHHGVTIEDPYHWLKDPGYPQVDDPHVLAYLEAENAYFESMMAPRGELVDTLFEEIKARQKPDDSGVPFKDGDWHYQVAFRGRRAVPHLAALAGARRRDAGLSRRKRRNPVERTGAGGRARVLPARRTVGKSRRRPARLQHRYRRLGALPAVRQGPELRASCWRMRSKTLWAARSGRRTIRRCCTWSWTRTGVPTRCAGTFWASPWESDSVIYEEHDPGFFVRLSESASELYILIHAAGHTSSEAYVIPAGASDAEPLLVAPRRADHEYFVDHQEDRFVIRTNDRHRNFRLVTAPGDDPSERAIGSRCLKEPRISTFAGRGLCRIHRGGGANQRPERNPAHRRDGTTTHVELPETVCSVGLGDNAEFRTRTLRLEYSSMITPPPSTTTGSIRASSRPSRFARFPAATRRSST